MKTERPHDNNYHENNFDLLRLVLASMVFLFHSAILSQATQISILSKLSADFAVQSFFVVSGYLIFMSYEKSASLFDYASKRFRRILPAYVMSVLLGVVIGALTTVLPLSQFFCDSRTIKYIAYNLFFMNFAAPTLPGTFLNNYMPAVNGSLWTLKLEVGFYLAVPVIYWLCQRCGYVKILVSIFLFSLIYHLGLSSLAVRYDSQLIAKFAKQLPGQLTYFIAGVGFYVARTRFSGLKVGHFLGAAFIFMVTSGVIHDVVAPIAVAVTAIYVATFAPYLGNFGKYGDFSYGIYIYHFPLVQAAISIGLFSYSPVFAVVVVGISVLSVAVLSWNLLERPALTYGK